MNYQELSQAIQDYVETDEQMFVSNIPNFVQQAEERIYNTVLIPALRKNVTGVTTASNKYLSCPDDFLAPLSLAVIETDGSYEYLLNKDVNFIRAAYPKPSDTGIPRYYALFGPQINNSNELSFILGPTPGASYAVELHYFYYPATIVQGVINSVGAIAGGTGYTNGTYLNVALTGGQGTNAVADIVVSGNLVTAVTIKNGGSLYVVGDTLSAATTAIGGTGTGFSFTVNGVSNQTGTSWLGDNYSPVLLYASMLEAVIFQKGEQDMVQYYTAKYQEALQQLIRLGDGMERGDYYRDGQPKIRVSP